MVEGRPWVKETRFGDWFQSTDIWSRYVLTEAVEALVELYDAAPESRAERPRVLEAGCGIGAAFLLVAQRLNPCELVAVDIDPKMVVGARMRAAEFDFPAEVLNQNVENLALQDESFDLVLCHQTIHHAKDAAAAVNEFYRVLRPGGWLLFAESCRRFIRSLPVLLLFRHPRGTQKTADEYLNLLHEVGFEFSPAETRRSTPYWSQPDFGLLERLGIRIPGKREDTQINVVARRPTR